MSETARIAHARPNQYNAKEERRMQALNLQVYNACKEKKEGFAERYHVFAMHRTAVSREAV